MLKTKKIRPEDALRLRVAQVKARFPKGFDYTTIYQYEFGAQPKQQLVKIRMVWSLRDADEEITENLEKLVKKLNDK